MRVDLRVGHRIAVLVHAARDVDLVVDDRGRETAARGDHVLLIDQCEGISEFLMRPDKYRLHCPRVGARVVRGHRRLSTAEGCRLTYTGILSSNPREYLGNEVIPPMEYKVFPTATTAGFSMAAYAEGRSAPWVHLLVSAS